MTCLKCQKVNPPPRWRLMKRWIYLSLAKISVRWWSAAPAKKDWIWSMPLCPIVRAIFTPTKQGFGKFYWTYWITASSLLPKVTWRLRLIWFQVSNCSAWLMLNYKTGSINWIMLWAQKPAMTAIWSPTAGWRKWLKSHSRGFAFGWWIRELASALRSSSDYSLTLIKPTIKSAVNLAAAVWGLPFQTALPNF